jgi:hypothetical protein
VSVSGPSRRYPALALVVIIPLLTLNACASSASAASERPARRDDRIAAAAPRTQTGYALDPSLYPCELQHVKVNCPMFR